ncbi:MAG: hypothetical protein ACI4MK_10140, partial [Aristaeellaceae bacterium]
WMDVYLHDRPVGTLAETADHRVAFSCSEEWLGSSFAMRHICRAGERTFYLFYDRSLWFIETD